MVKQSPKMTKLVVSAIKNLRDVQGSTTKDILNYVMKEYNSEPSLERRLRTALKRGIDYGILVKKGPHYLLNTEPEMSVAEQAPMERGGRRRKRGKKGRRGKKGGRRGRGRKRRGGKRKRGGKSRGRRRRSRRRRRGGRGKKMRKRGGDDNMDMLHKEPFEAAPVAPHGDPDAPVGPQTYDRPRSRSRSRQSRSRSRSRSSGSSDRENHDSRRQAD
ncbi:GSCOCG00002457001-RA-CDS [Cotesia congregata]|uniref:H15 domain-containing protein n=1 Tax=Cotesia congregata TaxID=51543 RepID=A0A8J2MHA8_COTCN|nr:GSCOCG00002457001-RA-CDS [Cotesia congregata]CAG5081124.1 Protein of unknown function [Cotesia congregata]